MSGKFKEYFGALELKKLTFVSSYSKDFIDTYEFTYDLGEGKTMPFILNCTYKKQKAYIVIDEMINYKKKNRAF